VAGCSSSGTSNDSGGGNGDGGKKAKVVAEADRGRGATAESSDQHGNDDDPGKDGKPPSKTKKSPRTKTKRPPRVPANTATPDASAKATMPKVVFSAAHAAESRVQVGDLLPAMTLASMDGKSQPLAALYGEKLTVVVFWTLGDRWAEEELDDLGPLVAVPYADRGVKVVAVHVGGAGGGGAAEAVRAFGEKAGVKFPMLLDPKGEALRQLVTGTARHWPRTYLVDSSGKILWFDVEYSRTTRRDLVSAVRFLLKPKGE
jgi:peroxiredoxin